MPSHKYKSKIKQIGINFGLVKYPLINYLLKHNGSQSKCLKVLDIGCGNHSPSKLKSILPESIYTGVDIQEYNIDEEDKKNADKLIILNPNNFNQELDICLIDGEYDFIIMSHVLEHLESPFEILEILSRKMTKNGIMYLSFPSEQSVFFPSAKSTLNFYDDPTHVWIPSIREILNFLTQKSLIPIHIVNQNHGGILLRALSYVKIFNVLISKIFLAPLIADPLLWNLYGFESVVVLQRRIIDTIDNKID